MSRCVATALALLLAAPLAADPIDDAMEHYRAGRFEAAVRIFRDHARRIEETDPAEAGVARNNACVILMNLGDQHRALEECLEAVRLRQQVEDTFGLSRTLNNLGLVYQHLGRYPEAEQSFSGALRLNREKGDVAAEAINLDNLGGLATVTGRYGQALEHHAAAARLAEKHQAEPWAREQLRISRINRGVLLERLSAHRAALDLLRQVEAEREELAPRLGAELDVNLGVVYRNLGDPVRASRSFHQAVRTFERLGDTSGLSNAILNLGLVRHLNLGQPKAAEDSYQEALAFAESSGDRSEALIARYHLGRLLLEQGRTAEARRQLEICLAAAHENDSAEGRWSAREGLARVDLAEGKLDAALAGLRAAMDEVEAVRAGLGKAAERSGYFGAKRPIYAAAVHVLAEMERTVPGSGRAADALAVVQRAKARELVDALGRDDASGGPLAPSDIRRQLGEALLLEYFLADGHLFLWTIDRQRVRMTDLGKAAPILERAAELHRALSTGRSPADSSIDQLSNALLGPLAGEREPSRLLIAPDGGLHYLPFEVLSWPGAARPLVESSAVTYLPTASTLAASKGSRLRFALRLLCYGNPRLPGVEAIGRAAGVSPVDLETLPKAEQELEAVRRSVSGKSVVRSGADASETRFRREAPEGARVIHLATHTVLDELTGRGAGIVLAGDAENDGLLFPEEVAGLEIDADLTVLAGCRTGLDVAGDGRVLSTLTGSFLAAGSRGVIATLWDVDDAATAVFMEQLYHQLGRGVRPDRALQATKQRLRRSDSWARPELWAGYVLVGDAPLVASRWSPPRWAYGAAAGAVVLMVGAWAARRRRMSAEASGLSAR